MARYIADEVAPKPISFAFKWQVETRDDSRLLAKRGLVSGNWLVLDKSNVPISAIDQAQVCGANLELTLEKQRDFPLVLKMRILSNNLSAIQRALSRAHSAMLVDSHISWLRNNENTVKYRQAHCPNCEGTVILTALSETPEIYCQFCNTLFSSQRNWPRWRICDHCGLYGRLGEYRLLFFFLLGWVCRRKWYCPSCARSDMYKLMWSFLFFPSDPTDLYYLGHVYLGSDRYKGFKGIHRANRWAKKKKAEQAVAEYFHILQRVEHSAGVRYNIACTLVANYGAKAIPSFYDVFQDCANYTPAIERLREWGENVGLPFQRMTEKLPPIDDEPPQLPELPWWKQTIEHISSLSLHFLSLLSRVPFFGWFIALGLGVCFILPIYILYLFLFHTPRPRLTTLYCLSYWLLMGVVMAVDSAQMTKFELYWMINCLYGLVFLRFWGIYKPFDGKEQRIANELRQYFF